MICEKILGKLEDIELQGKKLEFITVEWHEAFKKIHRKVTDAGREIGIRLDDSVLKTGLLEGDVLYADPELVIAVHTGTYLGEYTASYIHFLKNYAILYNKVSQILDLILLANHCV